MPDDLRSPIKHHLVLHRRDPGQGIACFYSLMIERHLFGTVRPGAELGQDRHQRAEIGGVFASEDEAGETLEAVARSKRRGYRDLY